MTFDNLCECPNRITRQCVANNNNECSVCGKFLVASDTSTVSHENSDGSVDSNDIAVCPEGDLPSDLLDATLGLQNLSINNDDCKVEPIYSNICVCGYPPLTTDKHCSNCGSSIITQSIFPNQNENQSGLNSNLLTFAPDGCNPSLPFGDQIADHIDDNCQNQFSPGGLNYLGPPPTSNTNEVSLNNISKDNETIFDELIYYSSLE